MKILLVAPFASLPGEAYFSRFLYLAGLLAKNHQVTLVTSRFRHFDKTTRLSDQVLNTSFNLILIEEPGYKVNVSVRRLWSHHVFVRNFKKWFHRFIEDSACDAIYSAYPLLETNIFLGSLKKKHGFRLIVDVQDVWPESILR